MIPRPMPNIIEDNTVEYFLSLGSAAKSEIGDTPRLKYVLNDAGHSRIFKADLTLEEADARIGQVTERLKAYRSPALWFITPMSNPRSLESRLKEHGFTFQKEWVSMALGLEGLPEYRRPQGFEVQEVVDREGLMAWSAILVKSFDVDEEIAGPYGWYFVDAGIGDRRKRRYFIGFKDGRPVAIGSLFGGKEAAGIFYVGTLKPYRGRGIGKAVTGYLLREASRSGYGLATLNASQMGYPLYKQLGFKEYYRTKIYQWLQ